MPHLVNIAVSKETRQKLKFISVTLKKSMKELITDFIEKLYKEVNDGRNKD